MGQAIQRARKGEGLMAKEPGQIQAEVERHTIMEIDARDRQRAIDAEEHLEALNRHDISLFEPQLKMLPRRWWIGWEKNRGEDYYNQHPTMPSTTRKV